MKKISIAVTAGLTAAVLAVGSAAAAAPTLAERGGPGGARGNGTTASAPANTANQNATSTVASGTLTEAQQAQLIYWVQEEKLAQDLYWALAAKYPDLQQFANIAPSETRHMDQVSALLATYGLADPTVGLPAGEFVDPQLQQLYNDLLASATTPQAALAAGAQVERTDLVDLNAAKEGLDAPDVLRALDAQIKASTNHLKAFTR